MTDTKMTTLALLLTTMILISGVHGDKDLCQLCTCEMYGSVVNCRERGLTDAPTLSRAEVWMMDRVQTINLDANHLTLINPNYWTQFPNLEYVSFRQKECVDTSIPEGVHYEGVICMVSSIIIRFSFFTLEKILCSNNSCKWLC